MNRPKKELQPIEKTSDTTTTTKATVRRATRGGNISHERICQDVWRERRKALLQRRIKVVKERADDNGSSEKWPPPGAHVLPA